MPNAFYRTELDGLNLLQAETDTHSWRMFHEWYAIPISFTCGAEMAYRGRTLESCPNHVNVLEPGEVHLTTRVHVPVTFAVAFVPPRLFDETAEQLGYRGVAHFRPRGEHRDRRLHRAMRRFIAVAASGRPDAECALADVVGCLLEGLAESPYQQRIVSTQRAFDAVVEAAHTGGVCPSIRELAAFEQVSDRQLYRSFARNHRVSPVELFQLVRVSTVMTELARPRSLAELASAHGFADQSHMNRVLRRVLGRTAGNYAKELQSLWSRNSIMTTEPRGTAYGAYDGPSVEPTRRR